MSDEPYDEETEKKHKKLIKRLLIVRISVLLILIGLVVLSATLYYYDKM